jgi:hypothetical protein
MTHGIAAIAGAAVKRMNRVANALMANTKSTSSSLARPLDRRRRSPKPEIQASAATSKGSGSPLRVT